MLPQGWQYPEITCAKLTVSDREFKTDNYRETEWKQSSDIKVHGARIGTVEVGYLEARPEIDEGPFCRLAMKRQMVFFSACLLSGVRLRYGKPPESRLERILASLFAGPEHRGRIMSFITPS